MLRVQPIAVVALASMISISTGVSAEEWKFNLGAGVGVAPDYEGSDDYQPVPLIAAKAERDWFFAELRGTKARANIVPSKMWRAGPLVNYRFKRNNVDDDAVDDLRTVDEAWELGAFGEFQYRNPNDKRYRITLGLEVAKDVASGHEGTLFEASAGYKAPLLLLGDNARWNIGVSSSYASSDYMDAYFSVDADNAQRSGLSEFSADDGIKDVGVNVGLDYGFTENWGFNGRLAYTRLVGDAEDSPIVDDRGSPNQLFIGLSIGYQW